MTHVCNMKTAPRHEEDRFKFIFVSKGRYGISFLFI